MISFFNIISSKCNKYSNKTIEIDRINCFFYGQPSIELKKFVSLLPQNLIRSRFTFHLFSSLHLSFWLVGKLQS